MANTPQQRDAFTLEPCLPLSAKNTESLEIRWNNLSKSNSHFLHFSQRVILKIVQ